MGVTGLADPQKLLSVARRLPHLGGSSESRGHAKREVLFIGVHLRFGGLCGSTAW